MNLLQQVRRASTLNADANHRRVHVDANDGKLPPQSEPPPIGVGSAIVMPYKRGRVPPAGVAYERSERGSEGSTAADPGTATLNSRFFLAMLAPSADAAMAYLQVQPSGAFVLVQHDHELLVFIKFRPTVRRHVLIRAKDIKKIREDEVVQWGRAASHVAASGSTTDDPAPPSVNPRVASSSAMSMAPVHHLQLVEDAYRYLERCWTRFLPHVQAMIFELCSESYYMEETITQEDWTACLMSSRVPSVAFLAPESLGFYLFNTSSLCEHQSDHAASQVPQALPVRVLEFDFTRCQIALANGTYRPSAFSAAVQLAPKKWFESDITIAAIVENFIAPHCVRLKEARGQGSESASAFAIWDSNTDPLDDREVTQLYATLAICRAIIPGHALPDELLDAIRDLHMCFAACMAPSKRSSFLGTASSSIGGHALKPLRRPPQRWTTEKARVAAQLLPFYLELFLSAASSPELLHAATPGQSWTGVNTALLPRLVRALSADIVHMARHVDDATVTGLVHHLLHAFVLRSSLPSAVVRLVDALFLSSQHFRTLFLRAGGVSRLWNAVCAATRSKDDGATSSAIGGGHTSTPGSAATATAAVAAATAAAPTNEGPVPTADRHYASGLRSDAADPKGQRRSSLFGIRRKSHIRASRTVDRNSAMLLATAPHDATGDVHSQSKTPLLVFVRMDPRQVQTQLASALKESHFPHLSAASDRPVWQSMTSLVLHVTETLLSDPASLTWERDVMATLRLDGLYDRLHSELLRGSTAHVATTAPECDIRGRPVAAHDRVTSFVSGSAVTTALSPSAALLASDPQETRLQTAIECVGALYRLEVLRRRHASTVALGEKRYWYFFHVLRAPLRDFHEHTRDRLRALAARHHQAPGDDHVVPLSSNDTEAFLQDERDDAKRMASALRLLERVLPELPRPMTTEFVLVSLEDILRVANAMDSAIEYMPDAAPAFLARSRLLLNLLTVVLRRTDDVDLQLLLVRATASSGTCIPQMVLRLCQDVASDSTAVARSTMQLEVLRFVHAFLTLANAVPQLSALSECAELSHDDEFSREDRDVREQRKTMLMSNVLSPGHGIVDDDELLWGIVQDVFLWDATSAGDVRPRPRFATLPIAERLLMDDDADDAHSSQFDVDAMSTVLAIRQFLYLSTILDGYSMSLTAGKLVHFHWKSLERLSSRPLPVASIAAQTLAARHLECLLVLAPRRSSTPSIDTAFLAVRAVGSLLETLDNCPASTPPQVAANIESVPDAAPNVPALDLGQLGSRAASFSRRRQSVDLSPALLRSCPDLHALTVLVVLACLIEGSRLDERLVPRYFVPVDNETSAPGSDPSAQVAAAMPREDVLWRLQRHLEDTGTPTAVHVAIRERLQSCTILGLCGSAARADAMRTLATLVLPNSFHSALYSLPKPPDVSAERDPDVAAPDGRTYLAKGAFAAVYRASSPFLSYSSESSGPAIKVLAHQRCSGELCVAAEVFHEVTVLRRLRGNHAATQLLDFGSRRDTQSFELVLECCDATLADWRRSLAASNAPFRAVVQLSLEVFVALGRVLQRVHAQSVCHFDIKSDNVLLRVPCDALSLRLVSDDADDARNESLESLLCLADFGEALMDVPVDGVQLSRTRGTEAIKSPEMLRVKGDGRKSEARISRASDVWSFGCLLFELLTQQLMFGGDDWAALFAHLAAEHGAPSVRADHREALLAALAPTTDDERNAVDALVQFLESILVRDAARRPTLSVVIRNAERLLSDSIRALPTGPEELRFAAALRQSVPVQPADPELLPMAPSREEEAAPAPVVDRNGNGERDDEQDEDGGEEDEDEGEDENERRDRGQEEVVVHRRASHARRVSVTALVVVLTPEQRMALTRLDDALRLRRCATERPFHNAIARLSPQFYLAQGVDWLGPPHEQPSYWGAPLRTEAEDARGRSRLRRPTRASLSELERQTEQAFHHYVYVCFDESQDRRHGSSSSSSTVGAGGSVALLDSSVAAASMSSHGGRAPTLRSSSFLEIVEGVRRTFVYVNRALLLGCLRAGHAPRGSGPVSSVATAGTTHLVALLLQYSRGLLTSLHRRVRQRHERVLVVPVDLVSATRELLDDPLDGGELDEDSDSDDAMLERENEDQDDDEGGGSARLQQLTHFASALLLHFLVMGCGVTPLRAVAAFTRECLGAVCLAPPATILQQLQDCYLQRQALRRCAAREQWTQRQRHVLSCHCGDKVLAVPMAVLAGATPWPAPEAEAWRRWQMTVLSGALEDELNRDPLTLDHPQHAAVEPRPWLIVDSLSVERLESQLRATLHRVLGASAPAATVPQASTNPRRSSLTTFLSRHMAPSTPAVSGAASNSTARSVRDHVHQVVHGLQAVPGGGASSDKWALLACGMCGSALCAVDATAARIALPVAASSTATLS
ncbi:hypothetical protein P43SY_008284 [Pythium insidiosum]|uniref:Protein kinase domain-containing protein n=1 Tax=Pythium insidiosum TaxID=114742 RepID=A0AAD5LP54_PYTIN|nr:hypothetical protein P43SY_008284 [Pythium insidiosum]